MVVVVESKTLAESALCASVRPAMRLYAWPFVGLHTVSLSFLFSQWLNSDNVPWIGLLCFVGTVILNVLTLLSTFWSVRIKKFICYRDATIETADSVMAIPHANHGKPTIVKIGCDTDGSRFVVIDHVKYMWNANTNTFQKLLFPTKLLPRDYLRESGNSTEEACNKLAKYGSNLLQIPIPSFQEMLAEQATAPFFVFQTFCVCLWLLDEYWYYSLFTLLMLIIFECTVVKQRQRNLISLRSMTPQPFPVVVRREANRWITTTSDKLVPGDIISIQKGGISNNNNNNNNSISNNNNNGYWNSPCDLLLLGGECFVNEAMLTGESVPQLKQGITEILQEEKDTPIRFKTHKHHIIFSGTSVVQHQYDQKGHVTTRDDGCPALVLKTGFSTKKGKLVRTMLCGLDRVTANNKEAFLFISILLIFAIAASGYVLSHGLADPSRNKFKLLLNCIMIVTSVIPPELPMELSLAVNTSLIALARLGVFCTEPFRIPVAGRVDICCFDKTGTLTSDELVVLGISGLPSKDGKIVNSDLIEDLSNENISDCAVIIGSCHSLLKISGGGGALDGDPLELAAVNALRNLCSVNLMSMEAVYPNKRIRTNVLHRYGFSSELKRMCTVCDFFQGSQQSVAVFVKGAPEIIRERLAVVPDGYDQSYRKFASQGARVIALARKFLKKGSQVPTRDVAESELEFCGFLVLGCSLKPTTIQTINTLSASSHKIVIITGDQPLTACHVAKQIGISTRTMLILTLEQDGVLRWRDANEEICFEFEEKNNTLHKNFDLCISGPAVNKLWEEKRLSVWANRCLVFSRVSPADKQNIIVTLKASGRCTLMCGDGTNDVGALKHSHIGVAILSHSPSVSKHSNLFNSSSRKSLHGKNILDEDSVMPNLGDASIASPFTARSDNIACIASLIRQGRCTLVTTQQMFKILAVNCLITAYSLSVLYNDGVKFGDTQVTVNGLMTALFFLVISRSKPCTALSRARPHQHIFNMYVLTSVLLQFVINLACLLECVNLVEPLIKPEDRLHVDADFKPNIINSAVFHVFTATQIGTFAINYNGRPFMEGLKENRIFFRALIFSALGCLVIASEIMPDLNELLELASIPDEEVRWSIVTVLVLSWAGCWLSEKLAMMMFGPRAQKAKKAN